MKKLYRRGTVHPSPPLISDHLAFLPATILTLTVALTPEDREVLAYLLSCPGGLSIHRKSTHRKTDASAGGDHSPLFNCSCFGCYTSYWVRWDLSPNRQLIHEIIDSFEDWLVRSENLKTSKKQRRKKGFVNESESGVVNPSDLTSCRDGFLGQSESVEETTNGGSGEGFDGDDGGEEEGVEKGSVRKFVSLIGERIWNVWGQ